MNLLLNDSSVLLNLIAGDCLREIVIATGWQVVVCSAVRDEVKKLRDPGTGDLVPIDIGPLISAGLVQVLDLANQQEQTTYIEQSIFMDDGEAMSVAIAANRGLDLAIDDKQATNHIHRTFPNLRLWSTPEILQHWVKTAPVQTARLGQIIHAIEVRARYFPSKAHPLAKWWQSFRGA